MHLRDERAGGVEHLEAAPVRLGLHGLRDAVRAEDHGAARRYLVEVLDEHGALGAEAVDDELVVHDLVAHVDRRAVQLERALDDLDGALDAGAEPSRVREQYLHGAILRGQVLGDGGD